MPPLKTTSFLKPLPSIRLLHPRTTSTVRHFSTSPQLPRPSRPSTYVELKSLKFPFTSTRCSSLLISPYLKLTVSLETQQAGLGTWTTALIIGLVGCTLLAFYPSNPTTVCTTEPDHEYIYPSTTTTTTSSTEENWEAIMTDEVQPGRPGTLTPEQEEKLRQFWIAASRVFGTIDDKFIEDLSAKTSPDPREKTQKKSRLGFLSRKHKNDSDADSTESERARKVSVSQADDKYGQNKQFQDTIAQQTPEALRNTMWSMVKHDHPDALLLRFLRARKWDVDKALVMMVSTMHWRAQEMHIDDDVILNGEEGAVLAAKSNDEAAKKVGNGEDFMIQLRMGKSFLHGADKTGRPICFVRAKLHKQGEQSEASLERCTVYTIETARMMLSPPVDTACVLFDLTGFSLANMDYAPVKFMIKCFEANYPESLGVVLVHKAPWVFQGVWKIIKGWLDPVVASKVHFTNSVDDLSAYIDKDHIPEDFGGEEKWSYKYIEPVPGENDLMKDEERKGRLMGEREGAYKRYEAATLEWIEAVEKGTETKEIKEKRHLIAEELRTGYWKLDPYIRARSFYDRTGVLNPDGKIEFWPKATNGSPVVKEVDQATTTVPGEETVVSPLVEEMGKVTINGDAAKVNGGKEAVHTSKDDLD